MLVGKNKTKMCKKVLCLIFAFLFSINSFAAVVSDNDGSAFVTKSEFEALKQNFANQIDNYYISIDQKIDGSIASYLAGIKVQSRENVSTGFDLVGGDTKSIYFLGSATDGYNLVNDLYGSDKIYLFANGGYSAGPDFYDQDSYDNWIWDAVKTRGNAINTLFLIDSNRCVKKIYGNVKLYVNRIYAFYSTTNARDGITWSNIAVSLNKPSQLISFSDAFLDTNNSRMWAKGYGHGRGSTTIGGNYPQTVNAKVFYQSGEYTGESGVQAYRSNEENKNRTNLVQQCSVSMQKSEYDYGKHWNFMPTQEVHTSTQEWDTIGMLSNDNSSRVDYTVTRRIQCMSGFWANWAKSVTKTRTVKGFGVKFNESLNRLDNIYYGELYDAWGGDRTKYKYTGGFPIFKFEKNGTLNIRLRSITQDATLRLTKVQNPTMPSTTSTDLVPFDQKIYTQSTWNRNVTTLSMIKSNQYDIRFEGNKDDIIYLNIDTGTGKTLIQQMIDAYFISE